MDVHLSITTKKVIPVDLSTRYILITKICSFKKPANSRKSFLFYFLMKTMNNTLNHNGLYGCSQQQTPMLKRNLNLKYIFLKANHNKHNMLSNFIWNGVRQTHAIKLISGF